MRRPTSRKRTHRRRREPTIKEQLALMRGQLDRIEGKIDTSKRTATRRSKAERKLEKDIMFNMQRAVDVATKNLDAFNAYKKLTEDMLAELRANAGSPEDFEKAMALFEANTATMAAAAVAGTPADTGEPVPAVVEPPVA